MSERGSRDAELAATVASPPSDPSPHPASTAATDPARAAPDPLAAAPPEAAIGRYRLLSRLGAGAMGEVWTAFDPQLERKIAIKLVHPRLALSPEAATRMLREARAMAKLSHRAVVAIHDAGEIDGQLFLAMELVPGRTLGEQLRTRTADELLDWRRWLALVLEAGHGLAAAHAAGVLHRDFKPDNVLVDQRGRVCVSDFGLASLNTHARARSSHATIDARNADLDLTTTGSLLGTPAYMSLQQLEGHDVDARADQFAFCVATYEALYGRRPFEPPGEPVTIASLATAIGDGAIQPAPPDSTVPEAVRAIVVRGLAAAPADRWPDVETLLAALARELLPVEPAAPAAPAAVRRHRPRLLIGVAAVLVLGVGLGVWAVMRRRPDVSAEPVARKLETVPMTAAYALSPGGRLAIGSDRVDVRDLATGVTRSTVLPAPEHGWVHQLHFDTEGILRWSLRNAAGKIFRWDLDAGAAPTVEPGPGAQWMGRMADGDVITRAAPRGHWLEIVHGERTIARWPWTAEPIQIGVVSPDRRQFAYIAMTDRFHGRIGVIDATGRQIESRVIDDLTAIAWRSDATLVFGTGSDQPWISELAVTSRGFGGERRVYRLGAGWPARLLAAGERLLYVAQVAATRLRLLDRDVGSLRDFEPSVAAGVLGWTRDDTFIAWTGTTGRLESRIGTSPGARLDIELGGEPANATFADDIAIVALRGGNGRRLVARSLTSATRWDKPLGEALVARCAGDRVAPCFVARRTTDVRETYEIVPLDPRTGEVGTPAVYRGPLEDFAVHPGGRRILVGGASDLVRELDLDTSTSSSHKVGLVTVRSLAYDGRGGFLAAGTLNGARYALGVYDGTAFSTLSEADGELLSLVRPAPQGGRILFLVRSYGAELWELQLPRAR